MTTDQISLAQALTADRRAFERSMAQVETRVASIRSPSDQLRIGLTMAALVRARREAANILLEMLRQPEPFTTPALSRRPGERR